MNKKLFYDNNIKVLSYIETAEVIYKNIIAMAKQADKADRYEKALTEIKKGNSDCCNPRVCKLQKIANKALEEQAK